MDDGKKQGCIHPADLHQIGQRIKEVSASLGRQNDIAEVLGVSRAQFQRYIAGSVPPSLSFLMELQKQTDVSMDWIATGKGVARISDLSGKISGLDMDALTKSLILIDEWLTKNNRQMSAGKKATAVAEIYKALSSAGSDKDADLYIENVAHFLRLVL